MTRRSQKAPRIVYLDIETTGFNPFHDRLLEIAVKDNWGNEWSQLIQCDYVPSKITEITHITFEMVKDAMPCLQALQTWALFLNGEGLVYTKETKKTADYIVGHNLVNFDWPFLVAQCRKWNVKIPKVRLLDTLRIAQYTLPRQFSYSLAKCCELYHVNNQQAHRAASDVLACESILTCLIESLPIQSRSYLFLHELSVLT